MFQAKAPALQRGRRCPGRHPSDVLQVLSPPLCSIEDPHPLLLSSLWLWSILRGLSCLEGSTGGDCLDHGHSGGGLNLEKLGAGTDLQYGTGRGEADVTLGRDSVRRPLCPARPSPRRLGGAGALPQVVHVQSCPFPTPPPLGFSQEPTVLPSCLPASMSALQSRGPTDWLFTSCPGPGTGLCRAPMVCVRGDRHQLHL